MSTHKKYLKNSAIPMTDDYKKETLQQLGELLRQIREAKGLTLSGLQARSGINEGEISRIENGKRNLAFTTLVKLSRGLDMTLSELLENFAG